MVNYSTSLDATFAALADPTRRAMLARLWEGEATVSDLAAPHAMSMPAITKHLRVLEDAGLVTSEKHGRVRHCRLTPRPLRDAAGWIAFYERFWSRQADALDRYLTRRQQDQTWPTPRPDRPPPRPKPSASPASSTRRRSSSSTRGRRRK
ncbi:MAG: metalloregulator ArsR/SmtB family transcription factor [Vicinamibacterales bacterium]